MNSAIDTVETAASYSEQRVKLASGDSHLKIRKSLAHKAQLRDVMNKSHAYSRMPMRSRGLS